MGGLIFTETQIQKRIKEIGKQITQDYINQEVILLGILKGSFIFLSDLCRNIQLNCKINFLNISSYVDNVNSGKVSYLPKEIEDLNIDNKNVIIVEDIIDSGKTIFTLLNILKTKNPLSLKVCSLLHKQKNTFPLKVDYVGFNCPDYFVFGYGLDNNGFFRNLPYICKGE